jgi:voltage-gated potassium channel Kch
LFFTFVYKAISEATPDRPLFVQTSTATSTDITYFSFVTLTTVGYGDFTAAQNGVKLLAVTEALFGQLYLVSAVALVISQFGRDRPAPWRGRRRRRGSKAATADADPTPAAPPPDPDAPTDP